MAMATATRLLLRSFRRTPPPLRPLASPSPAGLLQPSRLPPPPITHTQDIRQRLHTLPRALLPDIRWFPGRSYPPSTAARPGRRILGDMLSACFLSTSAAAALLDLEDMKSPTQPTMPHSGATTLLYWDDGDEDRPPTRPHVERDKRPMTDALIALHLLIHGVDVLTNRKLIKWAAKNNDRFRRGQIWCLPTSSLLHSGIFHITLNMMALDDYGSLMEEVTGPGRLLAVYATSALAGSLMSYRFTPGPSVGASDAICGLIGAQGVYTWRRRDSLTSSTDTFKEIRDMILFSLVLSYAVRRFTKYRIDNWAHFGGFLGGAAAEWFLGPSEKERLEQCLKTRHLRCSSNDSGIQQQQQQTAA